MDCRYELITNGETIGLDSILDLSKYYYINGGTLTSQRIFSTVSEVINTINTITARINEIKESKKSKVTEFVSQKSDLFRKLGWNQDRLSPEYIEAERVFNFVLKGLPVRLAFQVNSLKELEGKLSEEQKQIFDQRLKEIKDIIESEKLGKELGISLHKAVDSVIRGENLDDEVNKIIKQHEEILDNPIAWKEKLTKTLSKIHEEIKVIIGNGGTIFSELNIDSTEGLVDLKGSADIVVVDSEGNLHIYDLKISKHDYENWDSAKVLATDYQLAFYRGLLSQYVDVGNATLNIIPIKIGSVHKDNPDSKGKLLHSNLQYKRQISLLTEPSKGLHSDGKITRLVEQILPPKMNIKADSQVIKDFQYDLSILLPNYEIKTNNAEYNVDKIVAYAERSGKFDIFNNFTKDSVELTKELERLGFKPEGDIFKYEWGSMTLTEKREKYRKAVEIYVEYAKQHRNNNLVSLKNAIMSAINSGKNTITWNNKSIETNLNNLLKPYLLGNYRHINGIKELDDLGLILMQNKSDNSYSMLSISSFLQEASYDNDLLFGDLEYMKSYLFFNNFYDVLRLDKNKIEDIIVFNLQSGKYYYRDLDSTFESFNNLMKNTSLKNRLSAYDNVKSAVESAKYIIRNVLRSYTKSDKSIMENVLSPIINESINIEDLSTVQLKQIMLKFREIYPQIAAKKVHDSLNFNDDVEYLYSILSRLLLLKEDITPYGDTANLKEFGASFSDIKSIFKPLFSNKKEEYDADGRRIQGIIGGTMTVPPDKISSVDLRNINSLVNSGNSFVRQVFYKQSSHLRSLTRDYFKQINYIASQQNWLGNYRDKFEGMWVKDGSSISNAWKVKNPYLYDVSNAMKDAEREYLRKLLFEIKRWELEISESSDIDITSLDTLKNSKDGLKVLESIESGEYFRMPLVKNQQFTKVGVLWKDGFSGWVDKARLIGEEFNDFFDERELHSEERENIQKKELGYYEMYNIYEMQLKRSGFIKEMVDKNSPKFYELNLDIIAHRVAFAKIRQKYIDAILPTINAYMWEMKLRAGIGNKNISNALDYIAQRVKTALFDAPNVSEDAIDAIKVISPLKRITTAGMLAIRPVLLIKELAIGLYKGIALASTKIYGSQQFGIGSYKKALGKLITIDKKASLEFNLIDGINFYYGFANTDVNNITQKMQTSRRGILMGIGPWMYSTSTAPDYYNRLSLFLAKMIEEGTYEAHTLIDGYLQYDATKDKRFTKYFANRHLHKNSQGKYIPAKNDEEYNKQRNLYTLTMKELNENGTRFGNVELVEENDILPQAYSEKERLSFKSFVDTIYGYYDKDSQALWHQTWYGIIFLQFLQFWPGKMSQWYGKEITAKESMMGEHIQASIERDGKKILLWRKPIYSDINPEEILGFDPTEENTGDPLIIWTGTPQEGLMQSILKTARYAFNGEMGKFKSDKLLQKRFYFGLADGLLMMLLFGIIAKLLAAWIEENGTDGVDGQTIAFIDSVNTRISRESNVPLNTFGALNNTPAFWSYGTKLWVDMIDVFEGNKTIGDFSKNVKAFEIFNME